jgi:purine-binding chemotaxis protein CheW
VDRQLVVFELSGEHYGVDILRVDSIIRLQPVTQVPHAPGFVEGVTNLRGTVLPVVDLRRRFNLQAREAIKDARIVVAQMEGATVGMVVDAVTEVRKVPEEDIEPPSPFVTTVDSAFIAGIAKVEDGRLIILLDVERVLAPEEKAVLQAFQSVEGG